MRSIVFATANLNKLKEAREILGSEWQLSGLHDLGCTEEVPETSGTIPGNAIQKATYVYEKYGVDCFAEDTGLEITALNGEPGVYSARYAGPGAQAQDNIALVLQKMAGIRERSARFKTVIALMMEGQCFTFEGVVTGKILEAPQGSGGFGYDPIFLPDGYADSFGVLSPDIKNSISHRARALQVFADFMRKSHLYQP